MSLILIAVAAGVSVAAGLLAAHRRKGREDAEASDEDPRGAGKPAAVVAPSPFDGLALALGDVVSSDREERWLAGALIAREAGRVVSVLFIAPEGATHGAVAVFPEPRRDIFWLAPVDVVCPDEPPTTLEIGTTMLSRRARIPVAVERVGQGTPPVGETALWAIYEGGADVALLLCSGRKVHAWVGRRRDEGDYERLGGGGEG
jgi:hypothetical protein